MSLTVYNGLKLFIRSIWAVVNLLLFRLYKYSPFCKMQWSRGWPVFNMINTVWLTLLHENLRKTVKSQDPALFQHIPILYIKQLFTGQMSCPNLETKQPVDKPMVKALQNLWQWQTGPDKVIVQLPIFLCVGIGGWGERKKEGKEGGRKMGREKERRKGREREDGERERKKERKGEGRWGERQREGKEGGGKMGREDGERSCFSPVKQTEYVTLQSSR